MGLKTYNPTSPGRRQLITTDRSELWKGKPVKIRSSSDAIALGIGMVHQHFMLVDTLSCLDNVMLGAEPSFWLKAGARTVRAGLQKLMIDTGLQVRLDALVGDLPVGELQRLEILKALYRGAKVLILDEPFNAWIFGGTALVVSGVFWVTRPAGRIN